MRTGISLSIAILTLVALTGCGKATDNHGLKRSSDLNVVSQRERFFAEEFDLGYAEGVKLLASDSSNIEETRAWYLINTAKSAQSHLVKRLREDIEAQPATPWNRFAIAGGLVWDSLSSPEQAIDAAEGALRSRPDDADFAWLYAEALRYRGRPEPALIFLEEWTRGRTATAELHVVKGRALLDEASGSGVDNAGRDKDAAMAAFEDARRLEAQNVNAYFGAGKYLLEHGMVSQAYPLLKSAAELSSGLSVHRTLWAAIRYRDELTKLQQQKEIVADIEQLFQVYGRHSQLLATVAPIYGSLGMRDAQKAAEEEVLRVDPLGTQAEDLLLYRLAKADAALKSRPLIDNSAIKQHRAELVHFIERPQHHRASRLAKARVMLFYSLRDDPTTSAEKLLQAAESLAADEAVPPPIAFAHTAIALADRGAFLPQAERLAQAGVAYADGITTAHREQANRATANTRNPLSAAMYDALGWVYFKNRQLVEAEKVLSKAYSLNSESGLILHHLAKVNAAKGNIKAVEHYLIRCISLPTSTEEEQACVATLATNYSETHGSSKGFDSYLTTINPRVAHERFSRVVSNLESPRVAPPSFQLKSLDGSMVSSEQFAGKVALVGFFGAWCGVCRDEAAEFDRIAQKYGDRDDVVVIRISNDKNPKVLRDWIKTTGYQFRVLLDDGYVARAGITEVPSAWFLDREGRIAFYTKGRIKDLEDEYSERLNVLLKQTL